MQISLYPQESTLLKNMLTKIVREHPNWFIQARILEKIIEKEQEQERGNNCAHEEEVFWQATQQCKHCGGIWRVEQSRIASGDLESVINTVRNWGYEIDPEKDT